MWRLLILLGVLSFPPTVHTGSHSLWMFATFIIGETPFPEFSAVVMLDDVLLGYYDSDMRKVMYRGHVESTDDDAEVQEYATVLFGDMHNDMKRRALYLKEMYNHTGGLHVQQRLSGCEMLNNDKQGQMMRKDAFNGFGGEDVIFNTDQFTYQNRWDLAANWLQVRLDQSKWLNENVYFPICFKVLKRYLDKEKKYVLRKVKPRVRLLQKAHPDSGGVQVSCLATGFYPRHINLTLLRDGQPVDDQQITGGMLLPNGDGTYQMRKSLELIAEELRERHLYTCTASHLSLDNKLDITLEYEPGPDTVSIVSSVLVLVLVCVIVATAAFIMWRRRRRRAGLGSKSSLQSSYTSASSTEPSETSTDTSS